MRRSIRSLPSLATLIMCATACGPQIRFTDSIDNAFDLRRSFRYDDDLETPYVAGASFEIYVYDSAEEHDLDNWRLTSQDPEVLTIVEQWVEQDDLDDGDNDDGEVDILVARVQATGEGLALLEVYDDHGDFVRATEVEVLQPDRVDLRAAGPLFLDEEDQVPSLIDTTPKLLSGGTATFHVEWFQGERRLHGSGALGLASASPAIADLWERETLLDEDRVWATITAAEDVATADGVIAPIEIWANGLPVATVEVGIVGPDAVSHVELRGESDSGAKNNELLVVLAQAFDADDEPIWGVNFDWDLDGEPEPGEGDLFRYWFKRGKWNELGAEYAGVRGTVEIQGEEGFVDSSNDLSCLCSAGADSPTRGTALGLVGLVALGLVRRRPRASLRDVDLDQRVVEVLVDDRGVVAEIGRKV